MTMYELMQVSEHCYYIQSPAKIGLVKLNDTEVCLIDSGNDKEAGRKVRQILAGTGICKARPDAESTHPGSTVTLPGTRCWSRPSSTADTLPESCGTSS